MQRRQFLNRSTGAAAALAVTGLEGCAAPGASAKAQVLVVGGGYGGATAAKYIRLLSGGRIEVVLVEPGKVFISCPVSNLVVAGMKNMADISLPYTHLASQHGVQVRQDAVSHLDTTQKRATLASGAQLRYDKLLLAPGIDFMWEATEGLKAAHDAGQALHAWKAGAQTLALRAQLEAMPDGGTFAISIPEAPYRCPPGPYERASLVAAYCQRHKPRAKVLVLDANPDVTSKAALFKKAWADLYPGMLEYRPQHKLLAVEGAARRLKFEVQEDVQADVLNVLPAMCAGALARQTGLATANGRWCPVHFLNFESTQAKDVHLVGDAILPAQAMPKSAHMANAQAKVAAAAIVAELLGLEINPQPLLNNVCLSYVDETQAIHVASVHAYQAPKQSFVPVEGAGGVSAQRSALEGRYAQAWARNIWADSLL